jgi:hypothetical protein
MTSERKIKASDNYFTSQYGLQYFSTKTVTFLKKVQGGIAAVTEYQ